MIGNKPTAEKKNYALVEVVLLVMNVERQKWQYSGIEINRNWQNSPGSVLVRSRINLVGAGNLSVLLLNVAEVILIILLIIQDITVKPQSKNAKHS